IDEVLQLLLLVRLEEPGALDRAKPCADSRRLKVVEQGLRVVAGAGIAIEISSVEALRIPDLRQQLFGLGRIIGIDRRLPVEVEARGDDAPGDRGKPEGLGLVARLSIDGLLGWW